MPPAASTRPISNRMDAKILGGRGRLCPSRPKVVFTWDPLGGVVGLCIADLPGRRTYETAVLTPDRTVSAAQAHDASGSGFGCCAGMREWRGRRMRWSGLTLIHSSGASHASHDSDHLVRN